MVSRALTGQEDRIEIYKDGETIIYLASDCTKWKAIGKDLLVTQLDVVLRGVDDEAGGIYPAGRCRPGPAPSP